MKCTLLELFNIITQKRNSTDYYQEECLSEIEDYLQAVTRVSEHEEKVIVSNCHEEPIDGSIDVIAEKTIEVRGLLLYYYVIHDDEFYFLRINSYKELYAVMNSKLENRFIGDMVVFEDGKKKNYCVRDEIGQIVHYHMGEGMKKNQLTLEWC